MSYKIKVMNIHSAYRNAGLYIKEKHQYKSTYKTVMKMEKEFNFKYIANPYDYNSPHFLEFNTEKDAMLFILKWS